MPVPDLVQQVLLAQGIDPDDVMEFELSWDRDAITSSDGLTSYATLVVKMKPAAADVLITIERPLP